MLLNNLLLALSSVCFFLCNSAIRVHQTLKHQVCCQVCARYIKVLAHWAALALHLQWKVSV